jgi:peptidoglycan/xylan/chitin deacetylase (PgdA/CDA1 family)
MICLWWPVAAWPSAQVYVLCYHTFLGKPSIHTDFSVAEFDRQVADLAANGAQFVTLKDVLSGRISGSRNVLITIDDGNASVRDAYDKVLKPRGIKAVFAIYPGIISARKLALTWEDLRRLEAEGNTIIAHGYFHEYLTDKAAAQNPATFKREIDGSGKKLAEKLGHPVPVFAYPFGITSNAALREVSTYYQTAFTITARPLQVPTDLRQQPYLLPRYMMVRGRFSHILSELSKP